MAEEDDTPSAAETQAGQRQKRPPVTIDLEAEAVEPAPAAPPAAEPETPSEAAAEPPPRPLAEEHTLLRRLLPLAAAAVAGGVIGGGVAALLLAQPTDTITAASIDSRFATLAGRLDALEAKTSGSAAGSTGTATPAIDPARIAALEEGLAKLEQAPAPAATAAPDLQPLEQRLATLESRTAAPAPTVDLAPLEQRLAALDGRIASIEQHPPADPATEAAARTIALTALRQAALGDKPFSGELAAFATLGGESAALAEPLKAFAAEGAPSLAALQASFPAVAEAIRAASQRVDPEAGLFDRLAASAGSLVSVKPAGPVEGSSATAIVSRMEADVAKGDLAAALAESDGLDAGTKSALSGWAEAARRRLAIDGALATLAAGN